MERKDLHALAEERSLAFHRQIAEMLREDESVLKTARKNLARWKQSGSLSEAYIQKWEEILARGVEAICKVLLDPGERSRALRQTTPFAGAIDPRTRWKIHREQRAKLAR